jgi:hypothetical protein
MWPYKKNKRTIIMAKYQLLDHEAKLITDNIELTDEGVKSYGEDNEIASVFLYDEYEDGTTIYDAIEEGNFVIKRIIEE